MRKTKIPIFNNVTSVGFAFVVVALKADAPAQMRPRPLTRKKSKRRTSIHSCFRLIFVLRYMRLLRAMVFSWVLFLEFLIYEIECKEGGGLRFVENSRDTENQWGETNV
jgi:hypothetical protein